MKKRLFTLFLALCMVCTLLPFGAFAEEAPTSGTCGSNATWELKDGVLTISGTGDMKGGAQAWQDSANQISSVVIKSGITSIGYAAFKECGNITSIDIPDTVNKIDHSAFFNCSELTSVKIPSGVTKIENFTFSGCERLSSVDIPSTVKSIGESAFFNCCRLTNIKIPSGVTEIGSQAFYRCEKLKSVTIPKTVKSIGEAAFYRCSLLDNVTLPEGLTEIGDYAFCLCESLSNISLPDGILNFGYRTFADCYALENIKLPASITRIDKELFYGCKTLNNVVIPDGVTDIRDGAFLYCYALKSIVIPKSVTEIDENAFANSSLDDVFYGGSKTAWGKITVEDGNSGFTGATRIHYNTTDAKNHIQPKTVKPTCTEDGYTTRCCDCGYEYEITSTTPALGHKTELKNAKDATCTAKGYTGDKVCKTCGETIEKGKDIAALGHSWDAGKVTTKATCTAKGEKICTCTVCGATKTESIAALGHSWDAGKVTTKATCTAKGEKICTCTVCGATKTESIAALGHDFKNGVCTRCGAKDPNYKPVTKNPFVDVKKDSYCYDAVQWAVGEKITLGVDKTHFEPNAGCTRGQIVTFLWRANGCPDVKGIKNPFVDVAKGSYCYDAVLWAVKEGITKGFDATHFKPAESCTRGQIVTFLWRADGQPSYANTKCPFKDVSKGAFYYDAMMWAVENGITKGTDATHFAPNQTCTRGQIVTFLYRDMA